MNTKTPMDEIAEAELRKTNNPGRVARHLGMGYQQMVAKHKRMQETSTITEEILPEPDDITSLGRPGMEKYVVAIRRTMAGEWPKRYKEVLDDARKKYDAGSHEMFQGRKGGWFVQYLVPRHQAVKSRNYFRSMSHA